VRRVPLVGLSAIVVVAVEVAVFVAVAKLIGVPWALAALLVLSLAGGWLVPRQGIRAWRRFRRAAEAGQPPGRQVSDGLVGLLGALLLAVPGFVSALVGLALLVPPLRGYARDRVERSALRRMSSTAAGNLFGPRRVRVRRSPPAAATGESPAPAQSPAAAPGERAAEPPGPVPSPPPTDIIEGEIVDNP
jgi:UPF0716 protein FxsA